MKFSLQDITATAGLPLLKRCIVAFKPYWKAVTLATLSMGVVAACTAAAAFLVKPALDDIFIEKNARALYLIPAAYVLVVICKGVFQYLQNLLMKRSGLLVLEDLRNALYDKIIGLPLTFFEENQVGMLMSRIINDVLLIRMSLPAVIMLVRQILTMAGLLFVIFYRDWRLACWAMLVLPLAIYPFFFFARKLRKYSRRNQSQLADIASVLQEIFSGIHVVKAFATEPVERARFNRENDRLVKIAIKEIVFSELSSRIMELIGAIGMGLVIWYGGFKVISGESTPGAFFSFMAALIMLYEPLKKLDGANADIQRALAGAERVFEVLDSLELQVEVDGDAQLDLLFTGLEFAGVTFCYGSGGAPALEDINLRVAAGERVAIVGPSGAGKTTLVNLIPRFYLPQSGVIRVNGRDLNAYALASLRRRIGMVSQESFLFNASVAENVAYGEPAVDMIAVEAACRAAYAHEFVLELPEGYDTVVGERGVKLSGGQKQRLTIARALLKNPPLLILDEATSALDTESERIVQLALENLMRSRTSVVIAHRLSTVLGADRSVVMERGRIVAQGAHAELLSSCALYARLYDMQFRDESQAASVGRLTASAEA